MAFLFLPVLRYEIRQDDIRVIGVVGLCARSHVSSAGAGLVRHDHGPAMERGRGASLVCDPDRGCGGFSRWRKVEPVNRNLDDARPLQKDVMRNSCAPGTIPVLARKHTPVEVFPLSDAIGDRHAARVSRCSSSARASRTNPSRRFSMRGLAKARREWDLVCGASGPRRRVHRVLSRSGEASMRPAPRGAGRRRPGIRAGRFGHRPVSPLSRSKKAPAREPGLAHCRLQDLGRRRRPPSFGPPVGGAGGLARRLGRPLNAGCCGAARGTTNR